MKTLLYMLPICLYWLPVPERTPEAPKNTTTLNRNFFRFGDHLVVLEKYEPSEPKPYLLLSLHDNETSVITEAIDFARNGQAPFLRLTNNNQKNIEANLLDEKISIDPASIFSLAGRRGQLRANKCRGKVADQHVFRLYDFMLDQFSGYSTIVSLHSDNEQNIDDFLPGARFEKFALESYKSNTAVAGDYFQTNDPEVYGRLKGREFNVVLLNEKKLKDDGSLSVYCSRHNKRHVFVETLPGHSAEQKQMLEALDEVLK